MHTKTNRVLLATDRPGSQQTLGAILEAEGLEVCEASGAAALELAAPLPMLVILAADLAGDTQLTLCEELRHRIGPGVPILIELESRQADGAEDLVRAGADEILERGSSKPILRERIRQSLRSLRQRQVLEQRIERLEGMQEAFGLRRLEGFGSLEVPAAEDSAFRARVGRAVEAQAFEMHYQPKVAAHGGAIIGCEALMRWRDGSEWIPPARFIPALEEAGLIEVVGLWSLRAACDQLAAWQRRGLGPGHVAVNVSPLQFRDPALADHILEALAQSGIAAGTLQIEITEGCLIENPDQVVDTLGRLRANAIGISIDDFGTGFSSLQYLARLPLDCLKIDRTFVEPLERDTNARSLVMAIISMAWNLGLRVVAEGVETELQREFLIDHGCDEIQGFAISPALPPGAFERMLRREAED